MSHHILFPFTAIVGQERMKKALVLNAVNPALSGVLIRGQKGTAKSLAARGLAQLLPEIEVVEDCPFHCHPRDVRLMCATCAERRERGEALPVVSRRMHVVDLPLGSTEDRVIGTLNMEDAIQKGKFQFEPGLLAFANRGILYVDEVNLLDDHLVDVLLDSAAMGVNTVEREGISVTHPARFILVGTMNPEEGELRPQLLDRFDLCVEVKGLTDPAERVEVIRRRLAFETEREAFEAQWAQEEANLAERIVSAQQSLDRVTCSHEMLALAAGLAIDMGLDGHRGDIAMIKTARTLAAYRGRQEVKGEDIKEAAELVLPHRMRRRPFDEPRLQQEELDNAFDSRSRPPEATQGRGTDPEPDRAAETHPVEKPGDDPSTREPDGGQAPGSAEACFRPSDLYPVRRISAPSAPFSGGSTGRRSKVRGTVKNGRYVRSTLPDPKRSSGDLALDATLRAAAPRQAGRKPRGTALAIESRDIRHKIREKKVGNTLFFAVDASGSMGARRRMTETKGALLSLLLDAYQRRDRAGLLAFRGNDAEVLLNITSSVELARKNLEELPTGGKTPLAKGLLTAYRMIWADRERNRDARPLLILVSDGHANVSLERSADPLEEVCGLAEKMRAHGMPAVVIDTESGWARTGNMERIAEALGAAYYRLEDIRADRIAGIVREHISR
jgi:magnesium chelatase subunit D